MVFNGNKNEQENREMKTKIYEQEMEEAKKLKKTETVEYCEGYKAGLKAQYESVLVIPKNNKSNGPDFSAGFKNGFFGPIDWEEKTVAENINIIKRWSGWTTREFSEETTINCRRIEGWLSGKQPDTFVVSKLKEWYENKVNGQTDN